MQSLDLKEARREFNRRRGRGSKYDPILDEVEKIDAGKALLVEGMSYSEVTGLRSRLREYLGEGYNVEATKVNREKELYDVLIHREK